MNNYSKLYEEDVKMAEIKQKIVESKNKQENPEYEKIKRFIKDFPIELYLH